MLVSVITVTSAYAAFDCWGILLAHTYCTRYFSLPQFPDKMGSGVQYVGHKLH